MLLVGLFKLGIVCDSIFPNNQELDFNANSSKSLETLCLYVTRNLLKFDHLNTYLREIQVRYRKVFQNDYMSLLSQWQENTSRPVSEGMKNSGFYNSEVVECTSHNSEISPFLQYS